MSDRSAVRLLVLDNNPNLELHLIPEFRSLGYAVRFVDTSKVSSITELHEVVQKSAKEFRPHVAIVDLRIYDEDVDEDHGLQMLKHLSSASSILYSAYASPQHTRTAFKDGFVDSIEKHNDPEELISAVKEASETKSFSACGCAMQWPEQWKKSAIFENIFDQPCEKPLAMVYDVIFQLFPKNRAFVAHCINRAIGALPIGAFGDSIAFIVEPDNLQPVVVKLADGERIQEEIDRYQEFIQGRILGALHTRIENHTRFWDIGGVAYSLVGMPTGSFSSFSLFYERQTDPAKILEPLTHFFNEIWINHYAAAVHLSTEASLFDLYNKSLNLDKKLRMLSEQPLELGDWQRRLVLTEPVAWIGEYAGSSKVRAAKLAVTHGDFHGDNIFVDAAANHIWIIDFERTGIGHCLRDFTELSVDILTRLLPEEQFNDYDYARLCVDLIGFDRTGSYSSTRPSSSDNPEIGKAYDVVQGLYAVARSVLHFTDEDFEYAWSLLFDALFVAASRKTPLHQRRRAYILCAMLCQRLKIGHAVWPPRELSDLLSETDFPDPDES